MSAITSRTSPEFTIEALLVRVFFYAFAVGGEWAEKGK
jgi:hypothetical protein